jgi:UDP-glucose 4-epimerase
MGSDLAVEYAPDRDPNAVPRRLADTSRARARLGFVPEIDLETGFRELVEWWRAERRRHSVIGA